MGRQDALKALDRTKGMMISSGDKAFSQIAELDHAMDQLASGNFVLGEYHFTLAIYAASQEALSQQIATTRAELSNAGFVSVKEDLAVTAAFYAQFPGNWKYRTRLANVSSLNFLGLSPLHNFATGKKRTTPGATASPPCRPPTGRRITSISTPPIRRRTRSARRPSPTPWSSASPARARPR
jgi:Type IV secretory pathway, VirB4 components